jgi:uncharacterized protein
MKIKFMLIIILFSIILFSNCIANQEKETKMNDKKANHLINEQSPYLLQHAYNPVDWYPWGDEAFAKAKKENKPIFLSIGYSTCHWCHVMEHESFEDDSVAALMNEHFINIKVDREERPDIDAIYMTACQMLNQRGGWPLTIIMTPDKKPFYAGTYIPKESMYQRIGMLDLIPRIADAWNKDHENILSTADKITDALKDNLLGSVGNSSAEFTEEIFTKAFDSFVSRYDSKWGGFGQKPKFPSPHQLSFLLRYGKIYNNPKASEMVEHTLDMMRNGGMYDHLGYGFHRYSTDEKWLLPHFEKMLYDQAMLVVAYVEAWQVSGKIEYKNTAEEILEYVARDMTDKFGGFLSAEDADSEGIEGKFYVWEVSEINELLGRNSEIFIKSYGIKPDGNYKEEVAGHGAGGNILHTPKNISALANEFGISEDDLEKELTQSRKILFDEREKRVHPFKDNKVLTDWNGLMISAFSRAGAAFDEEQYIDIAKKAAGFIKQKMTKKNGELLHRYREGNAAIKAHLDDYAFYGRALLDLYEATFDVEYLKDAIGLMKKTDELFLDKENGGYYFAREDASDLISRNIEIYDGAIPSGNSVMLSNITRLGKMTGETFYEKSASSLITRFSSQIEQSPQAFSEFLSSAIYAVKGGFEIVIVAKDGDEDKKQVAEILKEINSRFIPNKVILFRPEGEENPEIVRIAEYVKMQYQIGDKATVYVCENFACQTPTNDIKTMLRHLGW